MSLVHTNIHKPASVENEEASDHVIHYVHSPGPQLLELIANGMSCLRDVEMLITGSVQSNRKTLMNI